jgi:hypothetical protein
MVRFDMAAIALDTSSWPLVVSTFPEAFEASELDAYLRRFRDEVHARQLPFVHLSDLSALGLSNELFRRKATRFMEEEAAASARWCRAAVHVVPSAIIRGALTAIFWIQRPTWVTAVVAYNEQARRWAHPHVERATLDGQRGPQGRQGPGGAGSSA